MKFLPKYFTKMYKFWYKTQILDKNCSFVPKNVHLVLKKQKKFTFCIKNEVFAKEFHQNVTVFIQNLYILVKYFGKNFIFSAKSTIFLFFLGPNVHFRVQNYTFYPKFVHFSEIFWQKCHL